MALLSASRSDAACALKALELPVTMVGSRAIATVGIEGTDVPLMVDSGAFFSFLTDAAAAQLHLRVMAMPRHFSVEGITGRADTGMATVKQVKLLNGEIPDVEFIVGGTESGSGALGILGRNLLVFADTEYDLGNGMIRFMFPQGDCSGKSLAYWAGSSSVSELELRRDLHTKLPAIKASAKVNGEDATVLFDTGAPMSLLTLKMAKRAGVSEAELKSSGKVWGIGREDTNAWTAPIKKFQIGDESIVNSQLFVADFDLDKSDMLLGIDFFLSHRIYVSKNQRRMFFTYNGGPVFSQVVAEASAGAASGSAGEPMPVDKMDAAGYARRGAASAARRDYASALADLNRACEMAPDVADSFTRRGQVHQALMHGAQALQDFDTALRLDPTQSEPRLHRASLRASSKDRDGAVEDLQALDKSLVPQANQRREMANIYSRLDLQDGALAQVNLWIAGHANEPRLDNALNLRCWARAMLGVELDRGLADCETALAQQPQNAAFLDTRGWLRLRRGEWRDAKSDFDRALMIRPEDAWSLYGRGIARGRSGDAAQGRADIETARKLLPTIDAEAGRHGLAADSKETASSP
jgi:predicted aspartyl protease/Tfp pilus assembly protein PilF